MMIFPRRRASSLPGLSTRRGLNALPACLSLCLYLCLSLAAASLMPAAASPHSHHRSGGSLATFYSRGDSNPHLANGDWYGKNGPWFCAVDSSQRRLLNHRIEVVNKRNGLHHVFLVADLGRFSRGNLDISRGGSSRLSGRGGPDNFPVEWHDLGPASGSNAKRSGHPRHRRQARD